MKLSEKLANEKIDEITQQVKEHIKNIAEINMAEAFYICEAHVGLFISLVSTMYKKDEEFMVAVAEYIGTILKDELVQRTKAKN